MHRKLISIAISAVFLVGCAYPRIIRVYDEECQIVAKKMILDVMEVNKSNACRNNDCIAQLVGEAALLAASTVVSGSIVVAGNVVYWLQMRHDCKPKQIIPEPAALPT